MVLPKGKFDIKFSVIVCTLNSAQTLAKTLESIYSQTYMPSEVILVDGFSTDQTVHLFNSFRRECDRLLMAPRSGPYAAMNVGIEYARFDIVSILNSDDYWVSKDVLHDVACLFSSDDASLAVVHGDIQVLTPDGQNKGIVKPSMGWERYCGLGLPFCHPATFIRRNTYLLYGKYNWIAFRRQADRDFGFRLSKYKVKSVYIPRVLTVFTTGGFSCVGYDRSETLRVIKRLPTSRRLLGQLFGSLTSLHPKYYSGVRRMNLIRFSLEVLEDFLRKLIKSIAKS